MVQSTEEEIVLHEPLMRLRAPSQVRHLHVVPLQLSYSLQFVLARQGWKSDRDQREG
jgi:hypothetical protein